MTTAIVLSKHNKIYSKIHNLLLMNNKTFTLEIREGKLIIPDEIENYLSKCSDNVKVFLTVKSESNNLANKWNKWFEEVEQSQSLNNKINSENDYKKLLINKYKQQGLEL